MTTEAAPASGFAAAVVREEGAWRASLLAENLIDDLDGVIAALRRLAGPGAVFGLIAVDDEFFVIVRPVPGGAAVLLSDATAALDYDLAADALDLLDVELPDDDDIDEEPWPEGDLGVLSDLGVSAEEMALIVGEDDMFPDEQLALIAGRCGFADAFNSLLEKV